jgi:glycolate oxidase iron-sulfur subunit
MSQHESGNVEQDVTPAADFGVFDVFHPPSADRLDDCVHCGFCLPACPTYNLWGEEMDSPRGRIHLMKLGLEGGIDALDDTVVGHFDACLGCMACVTACPSGVRYDELITATRAQVERNHRRAPLDRLFRALIFALFPHPARLRVAAVLGWLYQRLGGDRLLDLTGISAYLPPRLRALSGLIPDIRLRDLTRRTPALSRPAGAPRRRVGLLTGCVQQVFFADVNAATARVLTAEGCEVVAPEDQACCGALEVHAGREATAADRARRLIDVFERAEVDAVVVNAAGCGSNLKEYGHLLRDDPAYAERAAALAAKARDVTELLAELEPLAPRHALPLRVAYHDACHLAHAQGVRAEPRRLLRAVPGLELAEIAEPDQCCGSAGIYNLVQPEPAEQLGRRGPGHRRGGGRHRQSRLPAPAAPLPRPAPVPPRPGPGRGDPRDAAALTRRSPTARSTSTSSGGSCTSNSTPSSPTHTASSSSELDPVTSTQVVASTGSSTPIVGGRRSASASAGACRVKRPRCRYTSTDTARAVKSAASAGGVRGAKRGPIGSRTASRSTRRVRQSSRPVSHASRYQRRPACTNRCGSTTRSPAAPSRAV